MKNFHSTLLVILALPSALGASFSNLDFEDVTVSQVDPGEFSGVAVAAWEGIYYDSFGNGGLFRVNAMNVGAVSWPTITSPSAIAGNYSMGFLAFTDRPEVGVAQTATLEPGQQWLTLLTDLNQGDSALFQTGYLRVLFNDTPASFQLTAAEWNGKPLSRLTADLRPFAGQTGTLKILARCELLPTSPPYMDIGLARINIDQLQLVPEAGPGVTALAFGSAALMALAWRRNRTTGCPIRCRSNPRILGRT